MARNREVEGSKFVMVEGTTKNSKARRIILNTYQMPCEAVCRAFDKM